MSSVGMEIRSVEVDGQILRVGIRSGGHSWIANAVRHGGLTID